MATGGFFFLMFSAFGVCVLPTQAGFLESLLLNVTESLLESLLHVPGIQTINFTENVKFFQYFPNSTKPIEIISHRFLNPEYPTKIIIHGFMHNANMPQIEEMASVYHQKGNYNVIAVDWSKDAGLFPGPFHAAAATQGVGFRVGKFILDAANQMPKFLQNLHLIGHSLGAHVAGFAGKKVTNEHYGYIDRITGLDAAAPLFEIPFAKPPHLRLDRTDAVVVDLVHTDVGILGVGHAYGTADFYVNKGGPIQPGCIGPICSHMYAFEVFTQTIKNPMGYQAVSCPNTLLYELGLCNWNAKAFMGDEVTRQASGTYYLDVKR